MRNLLMLMVLAALILAAGAQQSVAQRSHRSSGGYDRGGDSAAERSKRADALIVYFDANQDGVIEPNEVHGQRRYVYERMAKEAGLDPTHSLSVAELRTAVARQFEKMAKGQDKPKDAGGHGSSSGKSSSPGSAPAPAVNGFGAETPKGSVSGFSSPAASGSSSGSSPSAGRPATSGFSSSSSGENKQLDSRIRKYAESLLSRYDANKNGVLEKDEWKNMRGSPEEGDSNHDNVITLDELTIRLANYGRKSSSSSSTSSAASSSTSSTSNSDSGSKSSSHDSGHSSRRSSRWGSPPREGSSSSSSDDRKSYRFLSPTERLPKGLPEWFARKDADGDGQVSMAEYSSLWDDAKAAEFDGLDLNHDGVITPEECLEAESSK